MLHGLSARKDESFISLQPLDNFYQTSAFFPLPFALITTVDDSGQTGIGPHALVFPFIVAGEHSLLLISRSSSGTAHNLRRSRRCALNYIEFDKHALSTVALLGYPGQSAEEKRKESDFTLIPSPTEALCTAPAAPMIIEEAFQIFECTWDDTVEINIKGKTGEEHGESHFVLRINDILLKEHYKKQLDEGGHFPAMPIFYGFRDGANFWFAEHKKPFAIPIPKGTGAPVQAVFYLANRLDEHVTFTRQACEKLSGIPRPFLNPALKDIIAEAKKRGVAQVDGATLDTINTARKKTG